MATVTTPLRQFSFQGKRHTLTGLRQFSFRQGEKTTTGLRYFGFQGKKKARTPLRSFYFTNNAVETGLRYFSFCSKNNTQTPLRSFSFSQDPQGFETSWKRPQSAAPSVTFVSSTGGGAELCKGHTLLISQTESSAQSFALQLNDPRYIFHPYGDGTYKDVMVNGAEVTMNVTNGGHTKPFFGTFKSSRITRDSRNIPALTWPGLGVSDRLFQSQKSLPTLGADPFAEVETNQSALSEIFTAGGVASDWKALRTMRIMGPWHRQKQRLGDIAGQALDMSVDEWRTEYKTVVGYDPTVGGRTWTYDTMAGDIVHNHDTDPLDNPVIDQAIVIRAIATGKEQATGEETVETPVDEFGEYTIPLNPPLSGVSVRREYASHEGQATDIKGYTNGVLQFIRNARGSYPQSFLLNRAWNIDTLVLTWGAANPGVTRRGVSSARGGLVITGRPTPRGRIGNGPTRQEPLDQTTRLLVPPGPADNPIELPPNPLLYNQADMQYHGEKYLTRVGRQQVEHALKVPLNIMIELGDKIVLKKDDKLGGVGEIEMRVISYTHSISIFIPNRFTQLTCVEYS